MTIRDFLNDLCKDLTDEDLDAIELTFAGDTLTYHRPKLRADYLMDIEFNEALRRDETGKLEVDLDLKEDWLICKGLAEPLRNP